MREDSEMQGLVEGAVRRQFFVGGTLAGSGEAVVKRKGGYIPQEILWSNKLINKGDEVCGDTQCDS